jgi:RNA polymerase primary sigma factor
LKLTRQLTNRESKSLDQYFVEIGKFDLLSPAEEVDLAIRIKNGDLEAQNKLVKANLRFVVSVAKMYQNQGISLGDLINEGNIGLVKAAVRFDETRGFKFISYAVWWIRQSILQAIAEKTRLVRLPLNRVGTLTKIGKVYSALEQEFERAPTPSEIADVLDLDSEEVGDTIKKAAHSVSMDSPLGSNSKNNRLVDIIQNNQEPDPDTEIMEESLSEDVKYILNSLPHREATILKLYFGLDGERPHTLEEVGVKFKLTRERVRQIKEKAIEKLRHSSRKESLMQYLG